MNIDTWCSTLIQSSTLRLEASISLFLLLLSSSFGSSELKKSRPFREEEEEDISVETLATRVPCLQPWRPETSSRQFIFEIALELDPAQRQLRGKVCVQVREREEEEDEQEVEEEKGAQLVRLPFGAEVAARIVRLDCSFSPFRHNSLSL